tara:strand:+ start:12667 stop:14181 length:1515 start_codon:yes stop_codon:yes gene_type:complete
MAAIITSRFRLDTTDNFLASLASNQFYMALGRANAWTDDTVPDTPYENDYANNTLWENMFAMKKIASTDIVHCAPRNLWVSGTTYIEYDDQDTNIESKKYFVITDNNNVYMCLKSGSGTSSTNPDTTGVQTSGVINHSGSDGYIWKYMFTVPATDVTKFLTASFIPTRVLTEAPAGGADAGLTNQWAVQGNAIDGAIYNMKITTAGTGYSSAPTLAIVGDGSNAAATAVVSGGAITDITMTNVGTGYTHATVTVTGGGGSNGAIRPVIGPPGGYGANPNNDLRSHYITINTTFTGDESGTIPDSNDFRQLALIKNPIEQANETATLSTAGSMVVGNFYKILTMGTSTDAHWETAGSTSGNPVVGEVFKAIATTSSGSGTIAQIAEGSAYNVCKKLVVATGVTFTADQIVEGHTSGTVGAKGMVVEYDASNGIVWYVQNEATGFGTFLATHFLRAEGTSIAGQDITAVTAPLINHHSGEVMFIENRTATTRADGQVETVRLVIAF